MTTNGEREVKRCKHEGFEAKVDVDRLVDTGRFMADIKIWCTQCEIPMRFIGLPAGLDINGAAVSVDATEARMAIAPKGEVVPALEGGVPAGFSVRRAPNAP